MIINELYQGSGLGNQIFCWATTRTIAARHGYDFGIQGRDTYKGVEIIDLDFGKEVSPEDIKRVYRENLIRNSEGIDITPPDPNIINAEDGTKIEGNLQALTYIKDYKSELSEWLKIKPEKVNLKYSADNMCVMHLRGSDYIHSPAGSFLPIKYYRDAMKYMLEKNKDMQFVLLSDDHRQGCMYADNLEIKLVGSTPSDIRDKYAAPHHNGGDISVDYAILNSAKNIILSNSTFAWWAAWTNTRLENIIAPEGWFTFSKDYWSLPDMRVEGWKYLDKNGVIR